MEVFCGNQVKRSKIMCILTEVDCYNQVGNQVLLEEIDGINILLL